MDRRALLKTATLAALATAACGAYDEKQIVNKQKMKIADPKHPTKAELKHTPEITLGTKDASGYTLVEVTVGQDNIIHPSEPNHWIYEIELYADGNLIEKVSLEPVISRGYLGARVKLDKVTTLSAIAKCNLHGSWESRISLSA